MSNVSSGFLFNRIAPIYGLFYYRQRRRFSSVLKGVENQMDLTSYKTILDVGCGTGALCSVFNENGISATGIDRAEKMLEIAKNKTENKGIQFSSANVLERLPFDDKSFDLSIASYVAHGMSQNERQLLYTEMCRVTRFKVIIYDYNQNRYVLTTFIEGLEGGDYIHFIQNAKAEMQNCVLETKPCFSEVKVVNVDERAAWYICTPDK